MSCNGSATRRVRWATGIAVYAAVFSTAAGASAGEETESLQLVCRAPDRTIRRHDGLFARADTGLAGLFEGVSGSATGRDRNWGIGQSAGIFVGGTPRPGLVVGGYIWTARLDPSFVVRGRLISPDDDSVKLTLGRIGPFVDWYPDPAGGFHAQVTFGPAIQIESDRKGNAIKPASIGAAGSFAVGYELFIGDQFSIGAMARFTAGALARSPGGREERAFLELPELLLTSTYQ